ncbi:PqiC family protein [Roseospira marina]|nr:ABC-type transport auxiliary lipoprotein family protein [Roseospira marina]MBB4315842.1 hypothetical protein [Roseospira marina]MBB5089018.1 hypothetical protein [Roseospira marina]
MTALVLRRIIPVILGLSMLAACVTSPPVRYHTLSQSVPAETGPDSVAAAQVLVQILPVVVPEGAARDNLVLKDRNGQITVLQTDRWLAPVADDMKQVVADDLWRTVRATDTYQAPVPADATALPRYRLAIRIERFDAVPGAAAAVAGSWTLRSLSDDTVHICRWTGSQPLDSADAAAAADALATVSRRLAAHISDSLRRTVEGAPDVCGGAAPVPEPAAPS